MIRDHRVFNNDAGGSVTKIGMGTLTLSGENTYTGDTNATAGELRVDGSIVSRNTFGNGGANLGGHGTIAADLTNNGIVNPGNLVGTLHVGGNFSQSSGGALEIELTSLLSFDQLIPGRHSNRGRHAGCDSGRLHWTCR